MQDKDLKNQIIPESFLEKVKLTNSFTCVNNLYVDMAGDLVAGILLSRIVYWFSPSKNGDPKLKVVKNGRLCLVKKATDWWEECRITETQYKRAIKILKDKGYITVDIKKFNSVPMSHIFLNLDKFLSDANKLLRKQRRGKIIKLKFPREG